MPTSAAAIPPARDHLATPIASLPSPSTAGAENAPSVVSVRTDSHEAARRIQLMAIRRVLAQGGPQIVYQPQLSLSRMIVEGYEALARFPETPLRGTELWFARARDLGLGPALEASAIEGALSRRHERPAGSSLAVNVSPGVLTSLAVAAVLPEDLTGIEIELTEHEWSPGSGRLRRELDLLRERGATVAIDDVGAAHSGLRRVMELAPDRIKLDRHLVLGVSTSTAKAALIRAVVDLAEHIDATVCAEGVESIDDLEALADLDVGSAQGWAIGLPEPDFRDAEPLAIAAGRASLRNMLSGKPTRSPADVEELLARLTTVTSLAGLDALAGTCADVLGADNLLISTLSPDGTSVRSVANGLGLRETFELDEYPLTRHCLQDRTVVPIYVGSQGDAAEWQSLARLGFQAALLVPVISRDRVIGLLECYREGSVAWSRRQIRSATTIAAMLGPVLDLMLSS
jgi:EAL domain-containing protein (putative c-di-GMP-specific phosphodiesterase class I)